MKGVQGVTGTWKGRHSRKWVYGNAVLPNSEMEQEAAVVREETADARKGCVGARCSYPFKLGSLKESQSSAEDTNTFPAKTWL